MYVIIFRSRLSEDAGDDYRATDELMYERVRALGGSDPMDAREYTHEDGERLVVLRWENAQTLEQWRVDPQHVAAKQMGREKWFTEYELTVAEVVRTSAGGTATDTSLLRPDRSTPDELPSESFPEPP